MQGSAKECADWVCGADGLAENEDNKSSRSFPVVFDKAINRMTQAKEESTGRSD